MTAPRLRRDSLRGRLLACLAESPLPVPTPDLALICAAGLAHPSVRVRQVLARQLARGRVVRFDPVPPVPDVRRGRRAYRWALTPAGLLDVFAARRRPRAKGGVS